MRRSESVKLLSADAVDVVVAVVELAVAVVLVLVVAVGVLVADAVGQVNRVLRILSSL
jgi:hypothetical protein